MKATYFLYTAALLITCTTTRAQSIVKVPEPQDINVNNGKMIIQSNGQVLIGVSPDAPDKSPSSYNLIVTKGILTERLKVANAQDRANWADFVFDKNYELMPLQKVETYIQSEKHLPGIPSAEEVSNNGIDVAVMEARLLQKIEELTLYVIQQQKQLNAQEKEIEKLKRELKKR